MTSRPNLKVLFVTADKYPPSRPAARAIFSEELVKRGHVIDWIIQAEKLATKNYDISYGNGRAYIGATDDGHSKWRRIRKYLLGSMHEFRVFSLASKNHYDLIQAKDIYFGAILAILTAKWHRIPFVYWLAYPHSEAALYSVRRGTARYRGLNMLRGVLTKFLLYKVILRSADHILVQSEQMKKDLAAAGILTEKMTPVPSSVNLTNVPYRSSSLGSALHEKVCEPRIVYLGTLIRTRRLDFLIRVLARILPVYPNAKLYLVGRGEAPEDQQLLRGEAESHNATHAVVFTGHLPMDKAWEYVRNADVCVSPYYPIPILNSTSPTKLVEYMAMGKAVVANDHPEQSLVIRMSGGGICVPWDESRFASAILEILDDPKASQEMGQKGRKFVEQYRTSNIMANLVEREYLRLCAAQRNRPTQPNT